MEKQQKQPGKRLDAGTLAGVLLAMGGILGGYLLEHGKLGDVFGESAAMIVLGGSLGATLLANPFATVRCAARRFLTLLFEPPDQTVSLIENLVSFATRARKNGLVSLEQEVLKIPDPFLRKSLMLAVDGLDLQDVRNVMELEMDVEERRVHQEAKVFESAGGFAPTIGIIGAVLGLIIVMKRLQDIELVGKGIATAFVATIYGVGAANLLFLPAAHKMKIRGEQERMRQELILEGVSGIVEGMNPTMIRSRLDAFLRKPSAAAKPARPKEAKAA